jgi:FecR protein
MNEDYLWDGSGPPDPEIARLEQMLAPFRYRVRPPAPQRRPRAYWLWVAAAAALIGGFIAVRALAPRPEPTAWQVDRAAGPARVGRKDAAASMRIDRGDVLRTGAGAQLELLADTVGRVELGPQSELRASSGKGLTLARGTLHAFIWAPPREFVVETPSSSTVDLGCEYTLDVDPSGDGIVRVSLGWVAFQFHDRESFIPAGAQCATRKASGPGIPFYEDAPQPLQASLSRFEHGDSAALPGILASARPRDGLTLWHLLSRTKPNDRAAVFTRFAELITLPAEVSGANVESLDAHALDLCWDALKLENTEWWRGWERRWN